jgi:hypothetical protein
MSEAFFSRQLSAVSFQPSAFSRQLSAVSKSAESRILRAFASGDVGESSGRAGLSSRTSFRRGEADG